MATTDMLPEPDKRYELHPSSPPPVLDFLPVIQKVKDRKFTITKADLTTPITDLEYNGRYDYTPVFIRLQSWLGIPQNIAEQALTRIDARSFSYNIQTDPKPHTNLYLLPDAAKSTNYLKLAITCRHALKNTLYSLANHADNKKAALTVINDPAQLSKLMNLTDAQRLEALNNPSLLAQHPSSPVDRIWEYEDNWQKWWHAQFDTKWEEIYKELYPKTLFLAKKLLTGDSYAEDIIQDTFTQMLRLLIADPQGYPYLKTYLYNAVRGKCQTYLDGRKDDISLRDNTPYEKHDNKTPAAISVDRISHRQYMPHLDILLAHQELIDAFMREHPKHAQLLFAQNVHGYNIPELARQSGKSPKATESEMSRARATWRMFREKYDAGKSDWDKSKSVPATVVDDATQQQIAQILTEIKK